MLIRRMRRSGAIRRLAAAATALVMTATALLAADRPTPDQAEQTLRAGSARFTAHELQFPRQDRYIRQAASSGQQPWVTILSCSDSRLPVELVLDLGIGDAFVVRVAGNVAGIDELASVEYGVDRLGTPLLAVLGHTDCGAVSACVKKSPASGYWPQVVGQLDGAVARAQRRLSGMPPDEETLIKCAIEENVWRTIEALITQSPAIYNRVQDGRLRVIGGIYNVDSGKLHWLGVHPRQQCLELADAPPKSKAVPAKAAAVAKAVTPPHPEGITSDLAQLMLREGNKRFAAGARTYPNLHETRLEQVAGGQHPYATILSCSDARVPVEHIFDAGLGDLFVVRVAGNVAGINEIGTIEHGVGQLSTPLLVVMGHTDCDIVRAAASGEKFHGPLAELTDNIVSAAPGDKAQSPEAGSDDQASLAVKSNVQQSISDILKQSAEVRRLVSAGMLQIIGAVYHLEDGYVEWLGPHPQQKQILAGFIKPVPPKRERERELWQFGDDQSHSNYGDDND